MVYERQNFYFPSTCVVIFRDVNIIAAKFDKQECEIVEFIIRHFRGRLGVRNCKEVAGDASLCECQF
jgi:hypothetical protein